ncbi:MAG TPA: methyl-accepting chemotaxis protein [Limnobacter sp.]|nr:methyl-accepting chemotaxis protein [Limnobacter sp.]
MNRALEVNREAQLEESIRQKTGLMRQSLCQIMDRIELINSDSGAAAKPGLRSLDWARECQGELKRAAIAVSATRMHSSKGADIVRTLNDVANQTNLLAFNAAIDAAHDGQQGIGIDLVASEVRKLASSSVKAARNIEHLIEESLARINRSAAANTETHCPFEQFVDRLANTQTVINEVLDRVEAQRRCALELAKLVGELASVSRRKHTA